MSLSLVRFTLGGSAFAFPVSDVREVVRMVEITHLPDAPAFVEGVVNLRGTVLPVIDMRKRLGLEAGPFTFATRILICATHGHTAGLIVDEVPGVAEIEPGDIAEDPSEALGMEIRHYVSGVVKAGGELVVVFDAGKILAEDGGVAGYARRK